MRWRHFVAVMSVAVAVSVGGIYVCYVGSSKHIRDRLSAERMLKLIKEQANPFKLHNSKLSFRKSKYYQHEVNKQIPIKTNGSPLRPNQNENMSKMTLWTRTRQKQVLESKLPLYVKSNIKFKKKAQKKLEVLHLESQGLGVKSLVKTESKLKEKHLGEELESYTKLKPSRGKRVINGWLKDIPLDQQIDFFPYIRGIYPKTNDECEEDNFQCNSGFAHTYTDPPNFSCSSNIQSFTKDERTERTRQQLTITCESDTAFGFMETVPLDSPLQTVGVDVSLDCLRLYIRQKCVDQYPVPNVVHWLHYGNYFNNETLGLRRSLSLYSVFTILKPCLALLHGNNFSASELMDNLVLPHAANLLLVPKKPNTRIYQMYNKIAGAWRPIIHRANQADIGRLEVLQEYGGIYLDLDEVILKPVDIFRAAAFGVFTEGRTSEVSNSVIFARPQHQVIEMWLKNYNTYDGVTWKSHSINYITVKARELPQMIQTFGSLFIRYDWQNTENIYTECCTLGDSFGIHLYRNKDHQHDNLDYIKTAETTYGRLARYILFNDARLC